MISIVTALGFVPLETVPRRLKWADLVAQRLGHPILLKSASLALTVGLLVAPVLAQTTCPSGRFTIGGQVDDSTQLCAIAERASDELATCNLPINRPINIEIVDSLPDGCVAEYHCEDDAITVLSPDSVEQQLSGDHPLRQIDPQDYLYSIVVHELAHAALDGMPCPFTSCVATQEFVAYSMQLRSLTPQDRDLFLTRPDFNRPIAAEEINAIIVQMAPDVFLQKSWWYLEQQEDPCGFVGAIAEGAFLFDNEVR